MFDPEFFRAQAEQCRELLNVAVRPEVIDQLHTWVREFEEEAEKAEAGIALADAEQHGSTRSRAVQ